LACPAATGQAGEVYETFDESSGFASLEPEYDPAGNLTFDGQFQYTYDAWNRLATVSRAYLDEEDKLAAGSTIATMSYDGLGRRIVKAVPAARTRTAPGTTTTTARFR